LLQEYFERIRRDVQVVGHLQQRLAVDQCNRGILDRGRRDYRVHAALGGKTEGIPAF
jgi:hypothetical protein